jgi:hypothetical protein
VTADISPCGTYRYRLSRTWGIRTSRDRLLVCMLNPSTADATQDDPTIRRCIGFAKREGCCGLDVVNAYALRATDPKVLRTHIDPIGTKNDVTLFTAGRLYAFCLVAWGSNIDTARERDVSRLLSSTGAWLGCLGVTKDGHPRHPLYVRADQPIVAWNLP